MTDSHESFGPVIDWVLEHGYSLSIDDLVGTLAPMIRSGTYSAEQLHCCAARLERKCQLQSRIDELQDELDDLTRTPLGAR